VNGADVEIGYLDVGEAGAEAPLLLVHGLGGRRQHWERVIPAISRTRRVLAIDLPGFGKSPLPVAGPLDLPGMADAIAALVRHLSLGRVVFVGHSFGGPLGTIFAARHRDLLERLVLVAGTVQSFQRTLGLRLRPWLTRPVTAVATVAELVYTAVPVPEMLRGVISRSPALRGLALWPFVLSPRGLGQAEARLLIDGAGAPGVLPTARAIGRVSGWERLEIDVPVTLINGDHDLIAPLADLRTYPGRVDQVLVVKDTGHLPMLERPRAFVAALEQAILADQEGG